jgi:N-acetylmuramoyl-L-alanine amidase
MVITRAVIFGLRLLFAGEAGLLGACFCFSSTLLAASAAYAAPPARTMYNDALAREKSVRTALSNPDAPASVLADVRGVVAAYEAVVKRHSTSGYSDNALWQAGTLALDAFAKFRQQPDRDTGVRLLHKLASVYVHSSLAAKVPGALARAGTSPVPPPADAARSTDAGTETASVPAAAAGSIAPVAEERTGQSPGRRVSKLALIKDIRRAVLPDAVRVTIEIDGEVPFHDERIANPARVFVDLPGTRAAPGLLDQTLRFDGDGEIVHQVRVGRHPNNTTRIVLEAAGVTSYSVYPLYGPYRLVIDCVRPPGAAAAAKEPPQIPSMKSPVSTGTGELNAKVVDLPPVGPVVPPVPVAPPPKNLKGGFSIARQLGLGVSRVVIDAGHGGHDPGAIGKGVTEAELVLDVALRLETLLQNAGVEVILTRRTDEFLQLQERTAIANREGADLFLSIHANASANAQARGIETYFLNFANTMSAAAVAARENAASGQAMGALPDIVKSIALNNKLDESRDFATQIQKAMVERLRPTNRTVKDLGVKQAPFVVLIGAAMPSVLAEISFVTNAQEARLLKGGPYRQRIADALFAAIRKYQGSLRTATAVAHQ